MRVTATHRGKQINTQRTSQPKKAKTKGCKSILDRFLNSLRYRESQTNIAHATMRLRPKITPKSLQRQSASDVKMLGCLCSTFQVRTARWTNVKTTTKPSKSKSEFSKRLAKVTQDSNPVSKFDNDQVNHSLNTMKELKELSPELDEDGIFLQPHQAHLRRGGNHQTNGGRHGVGMNSDSSFNPIVKVFRSQAMSIPL